MTLGAGFLQLTGMVLAAGLVHGMAAPFLASLQHRYPREAMAVSFVTSGSLVLLLNALRPRGGGELLMVALIMASFLVFSTSAGEWLFGRFTVWGRRLGLASLPARIVATWAAFVASSASISWFFTGAVSARDLGQILLWSLMAICVALPSMEIGREEYRKHLIAMAEGPEDLPEGVLE
jgi:hypothetical protein